MDPAQIEANITLEQALRRANLLAAATQVSQNITHIMDIDELLPKTVDIICDAYDFYYAGVFLIDTAGEFAVLRAGRGEPGKIMMENHHKLAVGGNSMIGACTALNEARISLDVDTEKVWYPNPVLPETRSEMALPLAIGDQVIGAVTVQSVESAAFSDEDISSLQAMANQLAIALDNAHKRQELEAAHAELLRAKTFEAIATATGDAIHWIGNKAEPIGGSVRRLQEDLKVLVGAVSDIFEQAQLPQADSSPALVELLGQESKSLRENDSELVKAIDKIKGLSLKKLEKQLSLSSMLDDLDIIDEAGRLIMRVKEDLIGPAREQAPRPTMLDDVVKDTITTLNLPPNTVNLNIHSGLSLILADPIQLHRVFSNLIKNAYEAMVDQADPQLNLTIRPDRAGEDMVVTITDNGSGIAEADLEKIWISFHTTKGLKGHAGLGLPACRLILDQIGGHISVTSQPDHGSTFTVSIPAYMTKETISKEKPERGKILLIDDSDNWAQFAATTLEGTGYKVTTTAANYKTGNYSQFDLIIVDDILANGDSLQVLKMLQEEEVIAKTLVISSNPRVEGAKERKLLGIHNIMLKRYTRGDLLAEVKNTITAMRS